MSILSIEAEHELTQSVLSHVDKLVKARIEQSREFPYKKKADLKRELSINEAYYKKLLDFVKLSLKKEIKRFGSQRNNLSNSWINWQSKGGIWNF